MDRVLTVCRLFNGPASGFSHFEIDGARSDKI